MPSAPVEPARPILIWDGDCGFCELSVRVIERAAGDRIRTIAYQRTRLSDYGLTEADCREAAQWIDAAGRASGAEAIAHALLLARLPWRAVGALLLTPPVRPVARVTYRAIARSRTRISRFVGARACRVENPSETNGNELPR